MFGNVLLKSLRDQRRALLGWGIGLVLTVGLLGAIFPVMQDMRDLYGLLASYPEAFRKLFDLDAMASGPGFMNVELFSIIMPVLFIVFAVGRGARLIAGEEEAGTLEVLLVTPLSPARLVLQQAGALAAAVVALGGLLFAATMAFSGIFDMGVGAGDALTGALAMTLLGVEHGFLALAVGAVTGRRAVAIAVAGVVAFGGYLLYVAGEFVESLEFWRQVSPFHQALQGGPMGGGIPASYLWMVAAALFFVGVCLPLFDRRDIATGT